MKLLEHSSSDMHTCPLCQSQLDESTTKKLKDSFQEEIHTKRMQFKENKELIDTLNENLISIKSNTENKTSILENIRSELTTKITIINKQIEDPSIWANKSILHAATAFNGDRKMFRITIQ